MNNYKISPIQDVCDSICLGAHVIVTNYANTVIPGSTTEIIYPNEDKGAF